MTQALECEHRTDSSASRSLVVLANTTAAYPLLALGALYGQWLVSWWSLGHQPRPSLDDPKYIVGASWMHDITCLALMGCVPVGCGAAILNTLHFVRHQSSGLRLSVRTSAIAGLWLGALLLLRSDPGLVVCWWLD